MRKVTREIVQAFIQRSSKSVGNSRTDGDAIYLHGHKIAWWGQDALYFSFCGWPTSTTKERLNGLFQELWDVCPFYTRDFTLYANDDIEIDSHGIYRSQNGEVSGPFRSSEEDRCLALY